MTATLLHENLAYYRFIQVTLVFTLAGPDQMILDASSNLQTGRSIPSSKNDSIMPAHMTSTYY